MTTSPRGEAADSASARYQPGDRVALFMPCYMDQFYPEAGEAVARVLKARDIAYDFPDEQTCCGQPAFNSGYWDEARRVVRHFADVFRPYKWIVCPSGSCTAMCRSFFGHLESDPAVADVGARVFELTEFLVDVLGVTDVGAVFPKRVALHVGCHTRRELGVFEQPERLLRSVKGLEYQEIPDVTDCCGFGGTFSVKVPEVSLSMGKAKAENIIRSGAEVLTSTDTSCLMHLSGIIRRTPGGESIRMCHIAEVLAAKG